MSTDDKGDRDVVEESDRSIMDPHARLVVFPLNTDRMDKLYKIMEARGHFLASDTINKLLDEEVERSKL